MLNLEIEKKKALSSFRWVSILILLISMLATLGWHHKGYVTIWQWYLALAVSAAAVLSVPFLKKISANVCGLLSLVCVLTALSASAVSNLSIAHMHLQYDGFQGFKLAALIFAFMIAAPIWTGYVVIGICGLAPVVLYFSASDDFQRSLPVQEPWITVIYAVAAFFLLFHRRRTARLERHLAHTEAQKSVLDRFARAMLALRDLSNTPIQTMIGTTAMLKEEKVEPAEIARINEQALQRLEELNKIISEYEHQIDWSQVSGSMDSMAVLKDIFQTGKIKK